ncbi:MAG: ADP-ribosylglycohydrolase family protein, partial [Bacilli bacterium]|nr:ADP-ribosylglycohydrolase family protein [Bacilli bacterium]
KMDDRMTDCNVNGAYAVISFLYGKGDYIETCKYASCMGFDGDCTAAICCGVLGIINGFKEGNKEYPAINEKIYMNGKGLYVNNQLYSYPARIRSEDYPEKQKITDIVSLYQENFEAILRENGGYVFDDYYRIPTTLLYEDRSFLFDNYDAECLDEDDNPLTSGFASKGGELLNSFTVENEIAQSGDGAFIFANLDKGKVYHTYSGLVPGHHYRLSTYITNSEGSLTRIYASDGKRDTYVTSATETEMVNKELIFMATSETMDVGIAFDHAAISEDEYVIFDNFQLEEIERIGLSDCVNADMKAYSESFHKVMSLPENVEIGEEVILSLEYDNAMGHKIYTGLRRNGEVYGGIVLSMTALKEGEGKGRIELPYVFES